MSDLSPEDRALVDAGGRDDAPSSAARDRVRRRLAVQLGAGAGLGIATVATKTAAATSVVTSLTTKIVLGAVLIGVVGAGGAALGVAVRDRGKANANANANANAVTVANEAPAATVAPMPSATMPRGPIVETAPSPADVLPPPSGGRTTSRTPTPTATPAATMPTAAPTGATGAPTGNSATATTATTPATPADALAEETRLLRDADAATRAGDAPRALALLAEHARRFPRGVLGEERDAETVLALCAAGRTSDARAAAQRFLAARPGSALAGRVRASCGGT